MSILSKKQILEAINCGEICFTPGVDQFQLSPIAVDLRVGANFFVPRLSEMTEIGRASMSINHLDNRKNNEILDQIHLEPGQYFELLPGEFILISTFEKIAIKTGNLMGVLYARSSTSRRGLAIESGIVDPYYEGYLTIPVLNQTKTQMIKIYPGERIAQIVFQQIAEDVSEKDAEMHGGSKPKYQGSKAYMLDYKFDPHDEINLIREGKLEELKNKFEVALEKPSEKSEENGKQKLTI